MMLLYLFYIVHILKKKVMEIIIFLIKDGIYFFLIKRISDVEKSINSIKDKSKELKCFCMNDYVRNNERGKKVFNLWKKELEKIFQINFEK